MKGDNKIAIIGNNDIDIDFDKAFGVKSEGYITYSDLIKQDIERYEYLTKKKREAIIVDIRREPKINRNSICLCGSGKKYKKCCIKQTTKQT